MIFTALFLWVCSVPTGCVEQDCMLQLIVREPEVILIELPTQEMFCKQFAKDN